MRAAQAIICSMASVVVVAWALAGAHGSKTCAAADEPGTTASNPGVSKELDILFRLAGRWRIEEDYPPTDKLPEGAKGKGTAEFKRSLEDSCIIGDYKSRSREMDTDVEGHAIFGYDTRGGEYRYWWFDNYGNANSFTGKFNPRKNALIFTRKFSDDPQDATMERHTFAFDKQDTVVFTMEFGTEPSDYDVMLTTTYLRKSKKATPIEEQVEKTPRKRKAGAVRSSGM